MINVRVVGELVTCVCTSSVGDRKPTRGVKRPPPPPHKRCPITIPYTEWWYGMVLIKKTTAFIKNGEIKAP